MCCWTVKRLMVMQKVDTCTSMYISTSSTHYMLYSNLLFVIATGQVFYHYSHNTFSFLASTIAQVMSICVCLSVCLLLSQLSFNFLSSLSQLKPIINSRSLKYFVLFPSLSDLNSLPLHCLPSHPALASSLPS